MFKIEHNGLAVVVEKGLPFLSETNAQLLKKTNKQTRQNKNKQTNVCILVWGCCSSFGKMLKLEKKNQNQETCKEESNSCPSLS